MSQIFALRVLSVTGMHRDLPGRLGAEQVCHWHGALWHIWNPVHLVYGGMYRYILVCTAMYSSIVQDGMY